MMQMGWCSVRWQRLDLPVSVYKLGLAVSRLNPQSSGRAMQVGCGPFRIP